MVRDMMQADMVDGTTLYGKTGTGTHGEGWYVGFAETGDQRTYFAVYLPSSGSGAAARDIAVSLLT